MKKKIENITLNDKDQVPSPPKYQESESITHSYHFYLTWYWKALDSDIGKKIEKEGDEMKDTHVGKKI